MIDMPQCIQVPSEIKLIIVFLNLQVSSPNCNNFKNSCAFILGSVYQEYFFIYKYVHDKG